MLMLQEAERRRLWDRLIEEIERYARDIDTHRVTPALDPRRLRALLAGFDFKVPMDPAEAVSWTAAALWENQTHTPHPRYWGLFNPAPTTMGIAADMLAAAFNPQLAAWSHSPLAIEIEQHLCRAFGARFGYDPARTDGTFCSGGAEANHTALLTALTRAFPEFGSSGLRALPGQPALYVSSEAHHSFLKAARLCGLGTDAVREIETDERLRMRPEALAAAVATDRRSGRLPFLIVATAGTTNAGVVDPICSIAEIASREGLWLHTDAAWGGAAVLLPELAPVLAGIERSDSITFDAHKWLSVPMGAGIFLTSDPQILDRTFRVSAGYMPREAMGLDVIDSWAHSIQWSRRFIGLKVFLSLAVAGWAGYETAIRHQARIGDSLREELGRHRWKVVNQTPLPLCCFVDPTHPDGGSLERLEAIVDAVVSSGEAWISTTRVGKGLPVIRACVTNYRTEPEDVNALVAALDEAREEVNQSRSPLAGRR
jgi:glutamate/tyrosine decarboxylase-like PLP-dependent enzyme